MKVIDLAKEIADNGLLPTNIKSNGFDYKYVDNNYYLIGADGGITNYSLFCDTCNFNDEVEIIEEDKKIPEKIDQNDLDWNYLHNTKKTTEEVADNLEHLRQKVNQIIDYLEDKQC